jgi:transposase
MDEITTIGVDLAKSIIQLHAIDAAGAVALARAVRRRDFLGLMSKIRPCLVGMEACAGAHHWARELGKLGFEVRLIAPAYVKAYVRRQKNDAADARAVCEAVGRPSMRFVPVKTEAQQADLMLHRSRALLVGQRTALICALRGHMAEFGFTAPKAPRNIEPLLELIAADDGESLTPTARAALRTLVSSLKALEAQIAECDRRVLERHRTDEVSRRLATIPGVGPLIATALSASIADPSQFASGREFAAFLGLVPRQSSTGGKPRLGRISKMGDRYLRTLMVVGAAAVLRHAKTGDTRTRAWVRKLLEKKPFKVVAVALANKNARIAWALMSRGETYRAEDWAITA